MAFTCAIDPKTISFLDLVLTGDYNTHKVVTSLYRKPMAGNTLLHAKSCHPDHTIKSVPVGEFTQTKRTCSDQDIFMQHTMELETRLWDRGYPRWMIERTKSKIKHKTRQSLIHKQKEFTPKSNKLITFSTMYSREYKYITKILKDNLPILKQDPIVSDILDQGVRCVARKAPSLANKLSPSLFINNMNTTVQSRKRNVFSNVEGSDVGCADMPDHKIHSTGRSTYKIKSHINCNSQYVVYIIGCDLCNVQYVGCTIRQLKICIAEHVADAIKTSLSDSSGASKHF